MEDESKDKPRRLIPANDNDRKPDEKESGDIVPSQTLDQLTLDIARLIGRQLARADFERMRGEAANDNKDRRA